MDTTDLLAKLGDQAINSEMLYLQLKIEKALAGENFEKEAHLLEAEKLWNEINTEYYSFLTFLQDSVGAAA